METLSFGYLKPETPDKGPDVFPALEHNIEQLNNHTHDGANSAKLSLGAFTPVTQAIAPGDWIDQGDGNHRMLITCPPGVLVGVNLVRFKDSQGDYAFLSMSRIDDTHFYAYTNSPAEPFVVLYSI